MFSMLLFPLCAEISYADIPWQSAQQHPPKSGLLSHVFSKISTTPRLMYKPFGELDLVLNLMIINDQRIHFEHEYNNLSEGKDVTKNSDIYPLLPLMDDGIIKMHNRLTEVLAEQYAYPIILAKGRLAELII